MEVDIDERLQNAFKEPRLQLHLVHGAYPSLQVGVHPFAEAEKRLLEHSVRQGVTAGAAGCAVVGLRGLGIGIRLFV